jgi:septin family protein
MREKFITDTRVHCCLFFIDPTGHSLKPVRVCQMRRKEIELSPWLRPLIRSRLTSPS